MEQTEFRRVERVKLNIPISLVLAGCESTCTLINISILGVGVSGTKYIDMHMGQQVIVVLPGVGKISGEIRWTGEMGAGISFDSRYHTDGLLLEFINTIPQNYS